VLVRLRDGETISDSQRRRVVLLADRPDVSITWSRYAPGERGPDLHVHREHTDAFYVLEGELTFEVGPEAERVSASPGGFVAVPPNVVHTFVNDGPGEARWLNFHAPDTGFAAYMRGLRDGTDLAWDSFDPPADGGRPTAETVVIGPGERVALPGLEVDVRWVLEGELELAIDGTAGGPFVRVQAPRASSA
jgi:quercetin dioxygenase-like cupin family protein